MEPGLVDLKKIFKAVNSKYERISKKKIDFQFFKI